MSDQKKNPAEDLPPAKKQRTDEGEEEEAAGAVGITIFESVNSPSLKQHPILRAAIQLTKGHLDRCLSKSEDKKKDGDHKGVLLGLPGAIQVRASAKPSYGFTDSTGICFDPTFVRDSSELAEALSGQIVGKNGDRSAYGLSPEQEFLLYSYLSQFQQTFEREVGHRKFPQWTPTKAPLYGKAGYPVQAQIRQDHVPAEDNASLSRRPQILEMRRVAGQYKVTRRRLGVVQGKARLVGSSTEVTSMQELVDLMNYPKQEEERDCQEIDDKPDFGPAPDHDDKPPGPGRRGGGGGSGGGDAGGSGGGGGGGHHAYKSMTWYKEAKEAMQDAVSEADSFIWNPVRDPQQSETAIDGYDITRDMEEYTLSDAEWETNLELLTKCEVEAVFCGADQQKNRSIFAATESIYVRLKVTNTTNSEVIYEVSRYPLFRRGLLRMFIEGVKEQGVAPGDRDDFVYAPILPGASYTFVRQLTSGISGDWSCVYKTPTKGTYWTQAGLRNGQPDGDVCFGKKFSFSIV